MSQQDDTLIHCADGCKQSVTPEEVERSGWTFLPILTETELFELTRYKRPADQLRVLLERGFYRAYRASTGDVVLERPHFEAVCAGITKAADAPRAKIKPLRLAMRA